VKGSNDISAEGVVIPEGDVDSTKDLFRLQNAVGSGGSRVGTDAKLRDVVVIRMSCPKILEPLYIVSIIPGNRNCPPFLQGDCQRGTQLRCWTPLYDHGSLGGSLHGGKENLAGGKVSKGPGFGEKTIINIDLSA